jgi:hypothetical protein
VGKATSAEELIRGAVEPRVLTDSTAGRPGYGAAGMVRDSEHGIVGHDSLRDETIIAFHHLLVIVLGTAAHIDCV